jgi:hypothetical protein
VCACVRACVCLKRFFLINWVTMKKVNKCKYGRNTIGKLIRYAKMLEELMSMEVWSSGLVKC